MRYERAQRMQEGETAGLGTCGAASQSAIYQASYSTYRGYLLTRGAVGLCPRCAPGTSADKDGRERWY
jgi:hypothetical protein